MECISALTGTIIIIIIIIIIILLLLLYQQNLAIGLNIVTAEQSSSMLIQEKTYHDHGFCI